MTASARDFWAWSLTMVAANTGVALPVGLAPSAIARAAIGTKPRSSHRA